MRRVEVVVVAPAQFIHQPRQVGRQLQLARAQILLQPFADRVADRPAEKSPGASAPEPFCVLGQAISSSDLPGASAGPMGSGPVAAHSSHRRRKRKPGRQ
jgi:hypothetical protein